MTPPDNRFCIEYTMADLAAISLTFSVLSFVLLALVLLGFHLPGFSKTISVGRSMSGGGLTLLAALLGSFSPDIALLSGFVSDILNGSFRFSLTSLVAIGSVVLNWLLAKLLPGAAPASSAAPAAPAAPAARPPVRPLASRSPLPRPPAASSPLGTGSPATGGAVLPDYFAANFNPCTIRGLGMFETDKSPMGIAALTTMFVIYMLDMTVGAKRSGAEAGLYAGFGAGVYLLNLFSYKEFQCYGKTYGEIARATLLPIMIGLAVGGGTYNILSAYAPAYLPLDPRPIGSGGGTAAKYATCSPPNDQDQLVCDAYLDGKRITPAIGEK